MASAKEELCHQILRALTEKLETRFRRASRGGEADAGPLLESLIGSLKEELFSQESRHREQGQDDVADTFMMVRETMLPDVARDVYARVV